MSEISSTRPLPAITPTTRPAPSVADAAVKLLQPLGDLMAVGDSTTAEVVSVKDLAQNFQQVLLKLTLSGGQQATVQATTNQPLVPGSTVGVTAVSDTRLSVVMQIAAGGNPLTSLDGDAMPTGTVIQGKVESTQVFVQPQTQQVLNKVVMSLLNTSMAGSKLALETPLSLPVGSLLTAQVQSNQSLAFLPLSGRLDQLELAQQLGSQQARQGSLEGLLKSLQGLSGKEGLPEGLRTSIDKLLGALPDGAQLSDSKGLSQALEKSGMFLEAKLLSGNASGLSQDMKANLLRLIAQILPALPNGTAINPNTIGGNLGQALPVFLRNALGALGQTGVKQPGLTFPLPSKLQKEMEKEGDLESLLKLAAAAVSRLQTHQLSSLAQSQLTPEGNLLTTWQMEIPMRNQQDLVPLQLKMQREDAQEEKQNGKGGKKGQQQEPVWRVELAFDIAPLGPLQVQAQIARGSLTSQLWAEKLSTVQLIDNELGTLRDRLTAAGLNVGELECQQGFPPQGPRTTLEQRWIDDKA
ncbi:flagellar hook-length control protein FliK [Pseudomonas turukhanskensis]|uniref:Flagellar hook-length control protein FliK n=1 Tax=Pseudomonas turukhanskensis TaxID=1806536 RepID=A0A9W6NI45_9PSED|nr:flagellar hook-length control protein FliK [Pseudomonas turukhanskensis]GLK91557.1 flagellar hook-length control protein FliK [Pseudomonas turukhanskensis]